MASAKQSNPSISSQNPHTQMIYTSKDEAKALAQSSSIKVLSNINNRFYMVSKNECVRASSRPFNREPLPIFQFFDEMDEEDFKALELHYSNFALKEILEESFK